jgi:hypothetical protein
MVLVVERLLFTIFTTNKVKFPRHSSCEFSQLASAFENNVNQQHAQYGNVSGALAVTMERVGTPHLNIHAVPGK